MPTTMFFDHLRVLRATFAVLLIASVSGCGRDESGRQSETGEDSEKIAATSDDASNDVASRVDDQQPDEKSSPVDDPPPKKQPSAKPNPDSDPQVKKTEIAEAPPRAKPAPSSRREELEQGLADLQVPPTWLASVTSKWDTNRPWKEGRIEIRRLLGTGDDAMRREGIKLTWDYRQKGDIGNGHEYPMYLFLGNEPIWAVKAYRDRLAEPHEKMPLFDLKALASLYVVYGMYEEAEKQIAIGMKNLPGKPWVEMRQAEFHDAYGNLYAAWGKLDLAKQHYREAIRIYPTGNPPYGKHLLPRRAAIVQSKLDLLTLGSLAGKTLKDGRYSERAPGYSGDVNLVVRVDGGRVTKIDVSHQEKIDQNACKIIPQRIVAKQSLKVDGISGATVTKDALVSGTYRALKKAGLE